MVAKMNTDGGNFGYQWWQFWIQWWQKWILPFWSVYLVYLI